MQAPADFYPDFINEREAFHDAEVAILLVTGVLACLLM